MTAVSPDDEHSHFPTYLPDGRLVYVSEHITLDQSWTDLWALPPGAEGTRTELVGGIKAQGPFELSPNAQELLFASPRSGNFEIYAVTLDEAGKVALGQRPETGRDADTPVAPSAAAAAAKSPSSGPTAPLEGPLPYLAGLVAVALVGVGIEMLVRARRIRG